MATYALPTLEENQECRRQYREWLRTVETWRLALWHAAPDNSWKAQAIAEELEARK